MNERIKLLAEQATIKTSHKYHTWGDRIATTTKEVFDREKFAELIVRECQFAIVSRTDLPRHERKLYNNVLKEHFGVEE